MLHSDDHLRKRSRRSSLFIKLLHLSARNDGDKHAHAEEPTLPQVIKAMKRVVELNSAKNILVPERKLEIARRLKLKAAGIRQPRAIDVVP